MNEVIELLKQKKVDFLEKGKDVLIRCLNPDHDDTHPSLRIDSEGGQFHCLGCGFKGNIFTYYNRHRNTFNSKVAKIKDKILDIRRASWAGLELPTDAFFVFEGLGDIPKHIMERFQAFETRQHGLEDRVSFPIRDATNRIVGFQGRYKFTDAPPKYKFYPGKISPPWFPNQLMIEPYESSIILVEGLRDMLHMWSLGYKNTVCLFGTKSVSHDNILDRLTPYMLRGIDTVKIMTDGDDAGIKAAEHLQNCIERKTDLVVISAVCPIGKDPATMSKDEIKQHFRSVKTGTN